MKNENKFKWEVHVGQEIYYLSDTNYNELLDQEKKGVRLITIGNRTINPAFISSAKKVYDQSEDMFETPSWVRESPPKLTSEQIAQRDKIKNDIRAMLKRQNDHWKNTGKIKKQEETASNKPKLERYQVKEALIDEMRGMTFPNESNPRWRVNTLLTGHSVERRRHKIQAFILEIDTMLSDYKNDFEMEAAYGYCSICQKYIQKELRLWDHVQGQVSVLDKLVV